MINIDNVTNKNIREHNPSWPQIPDHTYRMLIIKGSGTVKTISLFNLISDQPDIEKTYLNVKDPYEATYQLLINIRERTGLNHLNDFKAFIEYTNDMDYICKNIKEYNPNDMIADMLSNKKLNPIVTELFIRGKKLNISLVYITRSYFAVPKNIRLNSTHYYENSKQTRTSTNFIQSFIRY